MRVSPIGNLLLVFCVATGLASVLFMNLSWVFVSIALVSVFVYARMRFISEIESTDLEIEREILDKMIFAQEPISVKVRVINKGSDAIRGTIEDLIPEGAEIASGSNRLPTILKPKTMESFTYSVRLESRGEHKLGSLKIERVDGMGLFTEEQMTGSSTTVNAHTQKDSFDTARRIAGREHFEYAGVSRMPALVLREQEFQGIREYVPGDRARDILWKAFPKYGKLLTKTYVKEGSLQTTILMDCSRSMRMASDGVAKIDHAVDLSMQLANVLLSNFHPTGLAIFDEVTVLEHADPSLGRHQFENIVKVLRKAPASIRKSPESTEGATVGRQTPPLIARAAVRKEENGFLKTVAQVKDTVGGVGIDSAIRTVIARGRGQEQLFIVISDLVSCRDAVLTGARICQRSGNRMLVIQTYGDWYMQKTAATTTDQVESMYSALQEGRRVEAALRALGASYMRIGPADTASRIVRSIRRGLT